MWGMIYKYREEVVKWQLQNQDHYLQSGVSDVGKHERILAIPYSLSHIRDNRERLGKVTENVLRSF